MFIVGIQVLTIVVTLLVTIVTTHPYPWGIHQSNYDASLDPIAWSRGFVKDSIRKPRQFRTQSLLHNTLDGGEDETVLPIKKSHTVSPSYSFGKRRSSQLSYADSTNTRYPESPSRTRNMFRKKFYRRRQRLDTRDHYGFV